MANRSPARRRGRLGGQAGNRNALRHGMRTAEVAGLRRRVRGLLRGARALVEEVG